MASENTLIKRKLRGSQKSILTAFLVLPFLVLLHLLIVRIENHLVAGAILGYTAVISIIAYCGCLSDKVKAQSYQWRVPEANLHLFEMLGGWPGSFIAQRRFRHKIFKDSYQFMFWFIVIIHQAIAIDYLFDGPLATRIPHLLKQMGFELG